MPYSHRHYHGFIAFAVIPYLSLRSVINFFPSPAKSDLFIKNRLNFSLQSLSTNNTQILLPPVLIPFTQLMSIYNFSPILYSFCMIIVLFNAFWLDFTIAQLSNFIGFPVNSYNNCFAVFQVRASPACPNLSCISL